MNIGEIIFEMLDSDNICLSLSTFVSLIILSIILLPLMPIIFIVYLVRKIKEEM